MTSFLAIFGARFIQGTGIFLMLYGLFIATIASSLKQGFSSTWLIPIVGFILLIWGSKILHDRGIDFTFR